MASSSRHLTAEALMQLEDSDPDMPSLEDSSDSDAPGNLSSDSESDSDSISSDTEVSDARVWCPVNTTRAPPPPPRFPFTGEPGLKVACEHCPLAYLQLFFSDAVIDKIVVETNRYAAQEIAAPRRPLSRTRMWEPITKEDLWWFLGLIILQGVVGKPLQKWYWSTNKVIATPFFGTVMSEYRFGLIMKFLHFADNTAFDESTHPAPKLKKIWEVHQLVMENFRNTYVPQRDISVNESLMAFKGRLSWIQYIASKRARFGVKSYTLCESATGYIWNSVLYTRKGTQFNPAFSNYGLATSSVLSLVEPLLNKGYCLTTDNFYSSPELFEFLIRNKTDAYGTVRPNRREMPTAFAKQKLKSGDIVAWQKGKMLALRWRDKRDVCALSTVHDASSVTTRTRGGKVLDKPQVILDYNHTMGGVDRADQAMTYYPAVRKQQKKYYKNVFRHLLEQALWNAFILHKQRSERPGSHADFIWKLCETICLKYPTSSSDVRVGRRASYVVNPERLTGRHFSEYIPPTPKKATPTRMCVVCCSKTDSKGKKVRKETRFYCPDCDVGLCPVPCFKIYHTREVY
ncbi:piggyBac transposable element-derived protein 4-like [Hyperolius riggenbachi]|uniref:piggyBac transposable element-derived protein 4-like n=1 Tax=Hyperolius riggenbachi TaxID=752182 RepID=UPI0035A2F74D